MTPERWREIKRIFNEALDLPEADRGRYIEATCQGDEELRTAVERLLADDPRSENTVEQALGAEAARIADSPATAGSDLTGKQISHYRVLERLGEGGMGVVYKAEDLVLKRTVALKFLPQSEFTGEPERARFLREAQAAAVLDHPNICTVYEVGEDSGLSFIAMGTRSGHDPSRQAR